MRVSALAVLRTKKMNSRKSLEFTPTFKRDSKGANSRKCNGQFDSVLSALRLNQIDRPFQRGWEPKQTHVTNEIL
jgi:hypothetical protein